jgi:methyltransferase (TIGR00027 family)
MLALSEEANPQAENTAAYIAIRTKFFDDLLMRAMARGIRQSVLVAAGMDTRAFRLPLPADAVVYELDQAEALDWKDQTLAGMRPRCGRVTVPVDLREEWLPA